MNPDQRKIMNPEKQRKLQEYTRAIAEILYTEAESEQQFTQRKYRKNYSDTASFCMSVLKLPLFF